MGGSWVLGFRQLAFVGDDRFALNRPHAWVANNFRRVANTGRYIGQNYKSCPIRIKFNGNADSRRWPLTNWNARPL